MLSTIDPAACHADDSSAVSVGGLSSFVNDNMSVDGVTTGHEYEVAKIKYFTFKNPLIL